MDYPIFYFIIFLGFVNNQPIIYISIIHKILFFFFNKNVDFWFGKSQTFLYNISVARVKPWSIFSVTNFFLLLKSLNKTHLGLLMVNHSVIFTHIRTHIYYIRCEKKFEINSFLIWFLLFEIV